MSNVYLLAYYRSGSSFIRLCISHLTGYAPHQVGGNIEPQMLALLDGVAVNRGNFRKFHLAPQDNRVNIDNNVHNTLILLERDALENVCSLHFSMKHPKHHAVTDDVRRNFIQGHLDSQHVDITTPMIQHKGNVTFYEHFVGPKTRIVYEEAIKGPQHIVDAVGSVIELEPEAIERFVSNYEAIREAAMTSKAADSIRVNTFGQDAKFWHNLIGEQHVERFWQLYG